MALSIREFEGRVKAICPRWSVKARSLTVITDAGVFSHNEPIQVWERPYSRGPGFESDTLIMEIENSPSVKHLNQLRQGHWYRTQEMQKQIFKMCADEQEEKKNIGSRRTSYETKQFVMEHRKEFIKAARRAGITKGTVRHF